MCRAANADLAALPLDVPTPGSAIESFTSAYTTILTTAADVRRRHAACGGTVHWVDGSRHTPYRPTLAHPRPNSLPDPAAAMFGDAVTVPTSRFSQRALTGYLQHRGVAGRQGCLGRVRRGQRGRRRRAPRGRAAGVVLAGGLSGSPRPPPRPHPPLPHHIHHQHTQPRPAQARPLHLRPCRSTHGTRRRHRPRPHPVRAAASVRA
jgi:hypothetical protein